jgi:hypothetical protein
MSAYLAAFLKNYEGFLRDVTWCVESCSGDFDSLSGGLCWDRTDAHAGTMKKAFCPSWMSLAASRLRDPVRPATKSGASLAPLVDRTWQSRPSPTLWTTPASSAGSSAQERAGRCRASPPFGLPRCCARECRSFRHEPRSSEYDAIVSELSAHSTPLTGRTRAQPDTGFEAESDEKA